VALPVPLVLRIPATGPVQNARPVRGATLGGIVYALACLVGYRGRGWRTWIPTVRHSSIADTGLAFGLSDRTEEHSLWCQLSPHTSHLELVAVVSSRTSGGTTAPYVEVSAYDGSGVALDVGVRWGRDDGTLPGSDAPDGANLAAWDVYKYKRAWPVVVQTGGMLGDNLAVAATPTHPRMLYVADAAGERCNLIVTTLGAQLHSLTAIEYCEATL
jgi:hypothetical protein